MLVRTYTAHAVRRPSRSSRRGVIGQIALVLVAVLALPDPLRAQGPAQVPELRPANQGEAVAGEPVESPPQDAAAATAQPAPAAVQGPKPTLAAALERKGDLTFRNTTVQSALMAIAETWQVNIVTGKEIEGTVNGVFQQAPLREILDAVLLANGYSYRAVGDSLVVQASDMVGTSNPLFRSTTLPVRFANLDEVVQGAKMLASTGGQVQPLASAQSLLVVDYADRVQSITEFVARLEAAASQRIGASPAGGPNELEVAYFHTHFIPAPNAEQTIVAVLSPLGRVAIMPKENRLLVVDYPANLEMVRRVLSRVDRPRPQVRITALIYDLSLQDVEQLGINWGSAGKGNTVNADGQANQALEFDTTTIAPFAAGEAGGTLTVRSLTRNFDINAVANLLQTANDARLLADPNVIVEDNEEATWKSVQEIPYQQITQSELGGQIGTTAFKEAGITLHVRPTIAGDGTVEMVVEPEFSRLAGFTPQDNQPIIDTRKTTTTVRVANRQTLVLSGLRQRSDTGEFNGIPFLKDVRFVGPLFRSRDTNVRESELIVFIMPEVISYEEQPDCRQAAALETVGCRLDRIPPAEGCGGMGCDACAGGELNVLPEVDSEGFAPQMEFVPPGEVEPTEGRIPSVMKPAALRSTYNARFRGDNAGLRRQPEPAQAQ